MSEATRTALAAQLQRGLSSDQWNALYQDRAPNADEATGERRSTPPLGGDESPAVVDMAERIAAYRRSFQTA